MKKAEILFVGLVLSIIGLAACAGKFSEKAVVMPAIEGAAYVEDETCANCHEELIEEFGKTIHGRIADFETKEVRKGCQACHGPGSIHSEEGEVEKILSFKNLNPQEASAVCLNCHTTKGLMQWRGSEHDLQDITCTNCHRVHQEKTQMIKADPEVCYECHKVIRTKMLYTSHHPVREGKMGCGDCHDPHGGQGHLKTEERKINDLCLACHPDKQGPFANEHAAVVEGCNNCHQPHGTVANNLLKKTEPYLCFQCHHLHFLVKSHKNVAGTAGSKCTQCHYNIHGSDQSPWFAM